MNNTIKAIVIIAVTVLAVIPITVRLVRQNGPVRTAPASASPPPAAQAVTPERPRTAYTADQCPPFVDDPMVVGTWESVDFLRDPAFFKPGQTQWTGDLFLKGFTVNPGGTTSGPWDWSKGVLWHPGDKTLAKYEIKTIDGADYMFMEWISGDVTIRGMKPSYYVLAKRS